MALSSKALQRKREKKKKNKVKIRHSALRLNFNNMPIYECLEPIDLWENGLGQIIVSCKNSIGHIVVGTYVVDTYCLGVKDCFLRTVSLYEYKELMRNISRSCGKMHAVEAGYACALIHQAVKYAKNIGFNPHPDFFKARKILDNITLDETQEFVFGKNGKPFYIQGPNESKTEVNRIMHILEENLGKGGYEFMVVASNLGALAEVL
jgi:hypothetical protein